MRLGCGEKDKGYVVLAGQVLELTVDDSEGMRARLVPQGNFRCSGIDNSTLVLPAGEIQCGNCFHGAWRRRSQSRASESCKVNWMPHASLIKHCCPVPHIKAEVQKSFLMAPSFL